MSFNCGQSVGTHCLAPVPHADLSAGGARADYPDGMSLLERVVAGHDQGVP